MSNSLLLRLEHEVRAYIAYQRSRLAMADPDLENAHIRLEATGVDNTMWKVSKYTYGIGSVDMEGADLTILVDDFIDQVAKRKRNNTLKSLPAPVKLIAETEASNGTEQSQEEATHVEETERA